MATVNKTPVNVRIKLPKRANGKPKEKLTLGPISLENCTPNPSCEECDAYVEFSEKALHAWKKGKRWNIVCRVCQIKQKAGIKEKGDETVFGNKSQPMCRLCNVGLLNGAVHPACAVHNHPRERPHKESSGESKPLKGPEKRLAEKKTKQCGLGALCTDPHHYHREVAMVTENAQKSMAVSCTVVSEPVTPDEESTLDALAFVTPTDDFDEPMSMFIPAGPLVFKNNDDDPEPEIEEVVAAIKETKSEDLPVKTETKIVKKKPEADWEKYKGIVALFSAQQHDIEKRFSIAMGRMGRWMITSAIPETQDNVDRALEIVIETLKDNAYRMKSDDLFEYTKRTKILQKNESSDILEAGLAASDLFSRMYVSIKRPLRQMWAQTLDIDCKQEFVKHKLEIKSFCTGELEWPSNGNFDDRGVFHYTRDDGKKFFVKLPPVDQLVCKETMHQIGFTIAQNGLWIPRVKCFHNEMLALTQRQQIGPEDSSTPIRRKTLYDGGLVVLKKFWTHVKVEWDATKEEMWEHYLKGKTGTQKRVLDAARAQDVTCPEINYKYSWFIKREVLMEKLGMKKHPRCISSCDLKGSYLASYADEYYHMQEQICSQAQVVECVMDTRFVPTCGMNAVQVGELFTFFELAGCNWVETDLSRCDGHTSVEARAAELNFYSWQLLRPEVLDILAKDTEGIGKTTCGIRGNCQASEGSGRPDTSLGTTSRLLFVWFAIMEYLYIAETFKKYANWDFAEFGSPTLNPEEHEVLMTAMRAAIWGGMNLGDDGVTAIQQALTEDVRALITNVWDKASGHKVKIHFYENHEADRVTFCSSRFARIGNNRRVLVPMPFRTLSKTFVCNDPGLSLDDMPGYMRGIAKGFSFLDWMPIFGVVNRGIIRDTEGVAIKTARGSSNPHKHKLLEELGDVDQDEVRDWFFSVYGMHVSDFAYLEDVHFAKEPGHSWDLPHMREGQYIDGCLLLDEESDLNNFLI